MGPVDFVKGDCFEEMDEAMEILINDLFLLSDEWGKLHDKENGKEKDGENEAVYF